MRQRGQSRIDASFARAACCGGSAANEAARRTVEHSERTKMVRSCTMACSFFVHRSRERRKKRRATLRPVQRQVFSMLPPKAFLDAIGSQASRLFNGETPLPRGEFEAQLKGVVQGALNKLDVVSRDEFDSQMVVLARTRARLEALEAKVAELEEKLTPPAS
ncbi:conserved hypothetical protein [Stutzerimonas stutzeri A1501]|uniref:Ubiquinone biosynthesis accessory factor UbiK n=11 Tax=Pseudomonadaceae TaxID=135621 RepID=A4VGV6_STUS1|nr:conserved hypothetical protein [Stutzerimonas stutzeri A1501]